MDLVRDYNVIAVEINTIKSQTNKVLLNSAIEIGKKLKEAKEIVGHGNWTTWLEEAVSYSQRTASNLIKIYEEYDMKMVENLNSQADADLGYTQAVAMLKLGYEERENFVVENDIENMTTRELETEIKEKLALKDEKERLEKLLENQTEKESEMSKDIKEQLEQIEKFEALVKEKNEETKNLKAQIKTQSETTDTDPKELEKLKGEVDKKKAEVKELKKQLKEKPTEIEVEVEKVVEVVPKNVQEELDDLKSKLSETTSKLSSSESISKFKSTFELVINLFNELVTSLDGIGKEDPAEYEKYKTAVNRMSEIPQLPTGFDNWIRKSVFKDNRYIFYKKVASKVHGVCSSCKKNVDLVTAKHNGAGRCPACKSKIIYKAINKAKVYEDSIIVSIMQEMKDEQYVVRFFKAHLKFKSYSDDTSDFPNVILHKLTNPAMTYYEGSREIINILKNGKTVCHEYEELWHYELSEYKWRRERSRSVLFNKELLRNSIPFIYKRNLKSLLKKSKWKYSGLDHLKQREVNITNYINTYETYENIEILSKLNYQAILNQMIYRTCFWNQGSGILKMDKKYLGLSKLVFNTGLRLNLKISALEFLVQLEECGRNLKDEQIMWAIKTKNTETFAQLLRWVSPQKLINYAEKYGSNDETNFIRIWRDYLSQCETLKLNMKDSIVLFPKKLHEKHDEYSKLIKMIIDEKLDVGIKLQHEKWNPLLSYAAGKLHIEVAESHKLILEEGEALKHCVGSSHYANRMTEGKKLILFLRKNEKPYYTIEFDVEKMEVMQNRGLKNKEANKEVEKFISKWKVRKLLNIRVMDSKAI